MSSISQKHFPLSKGFLTNNKTSTYRNVNILVPQQPLKDVQICSNSLEKNFKTYLQRSSVFSDVAD